MMEERIANLQAEMNRRFVELREDMRQRFDDIHRQQENNGAKSRDDAERRMAECIHCPGGSSAARSRS